MQTHPLLVPVKISPTNMGKFFDKGIGILNALFR
jgi:hypothetical protein